MHPTYAVLAHLPPSVSQALLLLPSLLWAILTPPQISLLSSLAPAPQTAGMAVFLAFKPLHRLGGLAGPWDSTRTT